MLLHPATMVMGFLILATFYGPQRGYTIPFDMVQDSGLPFSVVGSALDFCLYS
jgi:hypothetical protein